MSFFTATALLVPFLGLCSAGHHTKSTSTTTVTTVTTHSSSTSTTGLTTATGTGVPAGFEPGVKWQIEIQDPVDPRGGLQPSDAKVIDVDLFQASMDLTLIPALHVSN